MIKDRIPEKVLKQILQHVIDNETIYTDMYENMHINENAVQVFGIFLEGKGISWKPDFIESKVYDNLRKEMASLNYQLIECDNETGEVLYLKSGGHDDSESVLLNFFTGMYKYIYCSDENDFITTSDISNVIKNLKEM